MQHRNKSQYHSGKILHDLDRNVTVLQIKKIGWLPLVSTFIPKQ